MWSFFYKKIRLVFFRLIYKFIQIKFLFKNINNKFLFYYNFFNILLSMRDDKSSSKFLVLKNLSFKKLRMKKILRGKLTRGRRILRLKSYRKKCGFTRTLKISLKKLKHQKIESRKLYIPPIKVKVNVKTKAFKGKGVNKKLTYKKFTKKKSVKLGVSYDFKNDLILRITHKISSYFPVRKLNFEFEHNVLKDDDNDSEEDYINDCFENSFKYSDNTDSSNISYFTEQEDAKIDSFFLEADRLAVSEVKSAKLINSSRLAEQQCLRDKDLLKEDSKSINKEFSFEKNNIIVESKLSHKDFIEKKIDLEPENKFAIPYVPRRTFKKKPKYNNNNWYNNNWYNDNSKKDYSNNANERIYKPENKKSN